MLSRKERVNVLIGRGVEGAVSVNLFEVTVDEAIRSIADAAGYVAERRPGGYVIIERDEAGKDAANANTIIRTFKVEYSDVALVASVIREHLSRYGAITELPDRRLVVVEDLPDFVARIGRLLVDLDKEPRQILIEAKVLEISLDDFGTGYSSLSYLTRLPLDEIKIDGSFVRELVKNRFDQKMVRLIAEIGREAGMKTIAEYVQSGPALVLLSELGVDMAQGYYIGRPASQPIIKSMPIPLDSRRKNRVIEGSFSA